MLKILIFISIFFISPISAKCASSGSGAAAFEIPGTGKAGEKITLMAKASVPLPASSFYRLELECPEKPAGAIITQEMGYPASDLIFSREGSYHCIVNFGILSKGSCAGVQYKALDQYHFSINIAP